MPRYVGHVIDEMPTIGEIESATEEEIVEWHLYLRPTVMQEELHNVKAITLRYEQMAPSTRERIQRELRRRHG